MKLAPAVLALVACTSAGARHTVDQAIPSGCGERRCVDVARDHERGRGVPRDYAAAYQAYRAGCDADEAIGCRKAGLALREAIGAPYDHETAHRVLLRGCELGDASSCMWAAWTGERGDGDQFLRASDALDAACARDDGDACALIVRLRWFGGPACEGECLTAVHDGMSRACRLGAFDGCVSLTNYWSICELGGEWTLSQECLDDDIAVDPEIAYAFHYTVAACDDGDADACEVLPDRAIPRKELCLANDFESCRIAAQDGDLDAARRACDAGLVGGCVAGGMAMRDGAEDHTAEATAFFERACRADEEEGEHACDLAADPDLPTGCSQFRPTRIAAAQRTKAPIRPRPALVIRREIARDDRALWDILVATAATGVTVYVAVDDPAAIPPDLDGVRPLVPAASAPQDPDGRDASLVDGAGEIRAVLSIRDVAALSRCVTALLAE